MRDALVFGTDSEDVRRKCIARGNDLTFANAKEIARTDEATRMQLKATNSTSTPKQEKEKVNAIRFTLTKGQRSKRRSSNLLRWLIYLIDLVVDNLF